LKSSPILKVASLQVKALETIIIFSFLSPLSPRFPISLLAPLFAMSPLLLPLPISQPSLLCPSFSL
jgi:hypothetical protein